MLFPAGTAEEARASNVEERAQYVDEEEGEVEEATQSEVRE
jgi:hypothetical protein